MDRWKEVTRLRVVNVRVRGERDDERGGRNREQAGLHA
jgi:hypothetical protein